MTERVAELFTFSTSATAVDWANVIEDQHCVYLGKRCDKRRKSQPEIAIGTCSVTHGVADPRSIIICPHRFLERKRIFMDSVHLLTLHEPGNELHVVSERAIPGGSVDYFLVSARRGKVVDFVGIEIQGLDTTGTAWPARQNFLHAVGISFEEGLPEEKGFGMNWKMTAKTILVQLHHKVETFEHVNKHLVLALQDQLLTYMEREFSFGHLESPARLGDSMHFHAYELAKGQSNYSIDLSLRMSTDAAGIANASTFRRVLALN